MIDKLDDTTRGCPVGATILQNGFWSLEVIVENIDVFKDMLGVAVSPYPETTAKAGSVGYVVVEFFPSPQFTTLGCSDGCREESSPGIDLRRGDHLIFTPCGFVFPCSAEDYAVSYKGIEVSK